MPGLQTPAHVRIRAVARPLGELLLQQAGEYVCDGMTVAVGSGADHDGQPCDLRLWNPRLVEIAILDVGVVRIAHDALHHHRHPDVGPGVRHCDRRTPAG